MSYIEIGNETQISTYARKWSTALYKLIKIILIHTSLRVGQGANKPSL